MDVKAASPNGDLQENVYMVQPEGFAVDNKEHMGSKLKKSFYGLKQAYRQWYIKFDEVIRRLVLVRIKWIIAIMLSLKERISQS
jgi:hypothetical protein